MTSMSHEADLTRGHQTRGSLLECRGAMTTSTRQAGVSESREDGIPQASHWSREDAVGGEEG